MRNLILKYALIGFVISLIINVILELPIGDHVINYENIIFYTIVFTLMWTVGMTCISFYNSKYSSESNDEDDSNKEGGVLYYYNDYQNGMCRVEQIEYRTLDDIKNKNVISRYSFVNEAGEYITDKWYEGASNFLDNDVAIVASMGKNNDIMYNIIDKNGNELSPMWFYSIYECNDNKFKVGWSDNTINFIDKSGNLLWKEWKKELVSRGPND